MKLGELLNSKDFKNRNLVTVEQDETVSVAIQNLAEHDKGALPVHDNKGELVGIITERDIVRKCVAHSKDCAKIKVRDVMSKQVAVGTPEDDLIYAISVMKQQRIRHLPIVDSKRVVGMISMRDLLGVQLEECTAQARFLSDYILGCHGQSQTWTVINSTR
jgi:CBS domain-containing protein